MANREIIIMALDSTNRAFFVAELSDSESLLIAIYNFDAVLIIVKNDNPKQWRLATLPDLQNNLLQDTTRAIDSHDVFIRGRVICGIPGTEGPVVYNRLRTGSSEEIAVITGSSEFVPSITECLSIEAENKIYRYQEQQRRLESKARIEQKVKDLISNDRFADAEVICRTMKWDFTKFLTESDGNFNLLLNY